MVKNLIVSSESKITVNKRTIHSLVAKLRLQLGFEIESLEINFVTPETIRKVNKEYLDHDYTTDIITFNYSGENYKFDGEIFISFDDALSNAKKFGCKVETELLRLVVHGILHLMGYDDIQESDKKEMKKIENDLVDQYKFLTKNTVII